MVVVRALSVIVSKLSSRTLFVHRNTRSNPLRVGTSVVRDLPLAQVLLRDLTQEKRNTFPPDFTEISDRIFLVVKPNKTQLPIFGRKLQQLLFLDHPNWRADEAPTRPPMQGGEDTENIIDPIKLASNSHG